MGLRSGEEISGDSFSERVEGRRTKHSKARFEFGPALFLWMLGKEQREEMIQASEIVLRLRKQIQNVLGLRKYAEIPLKFGVTKKRRR